MEVVLAARIWFVELMVITRAVWGADVGELILSLKLILDIFLNIWFYVGKEFEINSRSIIDFGLKQF